MNSRDNLPEKSFYLRSDVVTIARELIGMKLCTCFDGNLTSGIITETEAYAGVTDKGSHAYNGRRTQRTEIMFREGGLAYIYLCYGMYSLFNVVTNAKDIPHAVLIRAIKPIDGIETMLQRTGKKKVDKNFLNGPGKLTKALGLHFSQTGTSLYGHEIWIETTDFRYPEKELNVTPRIGIDYAGEDALLPYRFVLNDKVKK